MKRFLSFLLCLIIVLSSCAKKDLTADDVASIPNEPEKESVSNPDSELQPEPDSEPELQPEQQSEPEPQPEQHPEAEPQPEQQPEPDPQPVVDEIPQIQQLMLPPATEPKTYNNKDTYVVGFTDDLIVLRPQSATYESYIVIEIDTTTMDLVKNEIFYITGTANPLETPMPFPNDTGKYPIRYTMDKSCIVGRKFNAEFISEYTKIIYKETDFVVFNFAKRNIKAWCEAEKYCVGDSVLFEGAVTKIEPQKITLDDGKEKTVKYEMKNANIKENEDIMVRKPVIYLYPQKTTDVKVSLDFDGKLTCTYPDYNGLWQVTAQPDGTLTDKLGREYYCLYWEGDSNKSYLPNDNSGFIVRGEDTAEFLREKVLKLGLNQKEANEFIIYWLPLMQNNAYNYVYFSIDEYTDAAKLKVTPAPDSIIRFSMVWKAVDKPYKVAEQILPKTPNRTGFTVVEWGGVQIK